MNEKLLQSLLSGLIFFSSFSARTPNNESIEKDDYEVSIGMQSDNFFVKRDWERELGEYYVDDEIWMELEPKRLYIKPQFVNKTSRDLKYGKMDFRYRKDNLSIGYSGLYSDEKFQNGLSMGYQLHHDISDKVSLDLKSDAYYFRDEVKEIFRLDIEQYAQLNWSINDNLQLTNIFDYNSIKDKTYYKFRVGLQYKIKNK
jgi:hypothetical protein